MITIKGKINFPQPPASIPDGSLLTVKYQDTSLADAPSKILGMMAREITGYKQGDELTFEIKCNRPTCPVTTLGAVLNMGWQASGDEWVRKGDYLNDTSHHVKVPQDGGVVERNVDVIHYN